MIISAMYFKCCPSKIQQLLKLYFKLSSTMLESETDNQSFNFVAENSLKLISKSYVMDGTAIFYFICILSYSKNKQVL